MPVIKQKIHFSKDCFPDVIGKALVDVHGLTQAPLPMIGSVLMAAVSLACQKLIQVDIPNVGLKPCSLYFLTLAASGERKSTVSKCIMKPFLEKNTELYEKFIRESQTYDDDLDVWNDLRKEHKRALSKELKKKEKGQANKYDELAREHLNSEKPEKPRHRRTVFHNSDMTSEGLQKMLSEDPKNSTGLIFDEALIFFGGRAKSSTGFLNMLWDGESFEVIRKPESFVIHDVRLTASLMVQEPVFDSYMKKHGKDARASGFLARFLISKPDSTIGERTSSGYSGNGSLETFHRVITALLDRELDMHDAEPETLVFSEEAKSFIRILSRDTEENQAENCYLSEMTDFAGRYVENICRTAALFQFFVNTFNETKVDNKISKEMVESAVDFNVYYLESVMNIPALKIHSPVRDANELLGWMHEQHEKYENSFTKTILLQFSPRSLRNKKWLEPALSVLKESRLITKKWLQNQNGDGPDVCAYQIDWQEFNKQRESWDECGYLHLATQFAVGKSKRTMDLEERTI